MFSFRGYLLWLWPLTHCGGGRIFAVFWPRTSKNNDILEIYFVRNNCIFSDVLELVQNKISKKNIYFFGKFSRMYFSSYFLFLVMFLHCAFRVVHDVWLMPKKLTFFRTRQYGLFWLKHSHCGDGCHIFPPTGLNLESAEISQPQITDVKIHPVVPKVYTHLIFFGPMEMANTSKNFGNALVGLRGSNDAIHNFRRSVRKKSRKKKKIFRASEKMLFFRATPFGWRSEKILVIWLAGYLADSLAGWLFGNWLCGCLPGCLGINYLAGWLIRLALAIWLALWMAWMARSLACYLAI